MFLNEISLNNKPNVTLDIGHNSNEYFFDYQAGSGMFTAIAHCFPDRKCYIVNIHLLNRQNFGEFLDELKGIVTKHSIVLIIESIEWLIDSIGKENHQIFKEFAAVEDIKVFYKIMI